MKFWRRIFFVFLGLVCVCFLQWLRIAFIIRKSLCQTQTCLSFGPGLCFHEEAIPWWPLTSSTDGPPSGRHWGILLSKCYFPSIPPDVWLSRAALRSHPNLKLTLYPTTGGQGVGRASQGAIQTLWQKPPSKPICLPLQGLASISCEDPTSCILAPHATVTTSLPPASLQALHSLWLPGHLPDRSEPTWRKHVPF